MTLIIIAKGARCAITNADIWRVIWFSKVYIASLHKRGRVEGLIFLSLTSDALWWSRDVQIKSRHAFYQHIWFEACKKSSIYYKFNDFNFILKYNIFYK